MKTDIEIAQEAKMEPIVRVRKASGSERTIWSCTGATKRRYRKITSGLFRIARTES